MKFELAAFVSAIIVQGAASETSKWFSCDKIPTTGPIAYEKAECGKLSAPLCYPGVCTAPNGVKQTIEIFVKRYPAADSETATNVWMIGDDAGFASDFIEVTMALLNLNLNESVNIYTMHLRGSGRSTRLGCAVEKSARALGSVMDPAQVGSCAQELEAKYGNLAAFSPTSAAHDVVNLITKLSNGASTILYGSQYGALVVERVMHLAPPGVTGYILDGPLSTTGNYLTQHDRDAGEVASAFMKRCDHDRVCSSHFKKPNTLSVVYQRILADMDNQVNSSCLEMMGTTDILNRNITGSQNLRSVFLILLYYPMTYLTIPQLFYRLNRCQANDIIVLKAFFAKLMNTGNLSSGPRFSEVLNYLISFSEFWERPTPMLAEMTKRSTDSFAGCAAFDKLPMYCAFSKERSRACAKYDFGQYEAQGIIYEHDQYWNASVSIPRQASVLVLSSKMDVYAPHKYTKRLVESLNGANKELVIFEYGVRGVLTSPYMQFRTFEIETCTTKVLASYIRSDGDLSGLDKSCLDEMETFEMIPSDFSEASFIDSL